MADENRAANDGLNNGLNDELNDEARMPFVEHLRDLRVRLRNSIIALIVGVCVVYLFKDQVVDFLLSPYVQAWKEQQATNPALGEVRIQYTDLAAPFWAYLGLAVFAGVFVSSPFIFHQLWQFIAPGLYKNERRYGVSFAIASAFFFTGGAIFCYYLVLPIVFDFFLSYSTVFEVGGEAVPVEARPNIDTYLSLERKLLLGFGLVFELPLGIFFLSMIGVVTHRGLWRFNRWWIVLSFVLAAALTPPDVFSQSLMAAPLIILYNLSIVIAYIMTRRRERKEAALMGPD